MALSRVLVLNKSVSLCSTEDKRTIKKIICQGLKTFANQKF